MSTTARAVSFASQLAKASKLAASLSTNMFRLPRVTLALRKDHAIFTGIQGFKNIELLYQKYKLHQMCIEQGSCSGFPFYSPHPIWLKNMPYTKNTTIFGDISVESCFALKVEVPGHENCQIDKVVTITTESSDQFDRFMEPYSFRSFINTHIISNDMATPERICSYIYTNEDNCVLPAQTLLDNIILTSSPGVKVPITFDVVVASDNELGIDDEWDKIREWAKKV